MTAPSLYTKVALAAVVLVGAWLRLRAITHGLTAEEVSDVEHGALDYYTRGPELGVNPPLLRFLLNQLFECRDTLVAGRILSLVCGIVAPLWLFAVARRASRGSGAAGLFAAALAVALPMGVETSTEFRSYAPFLACTAAMFAALCAAIDAPTLWRRRFHVTGFTLCAMLLPHLHYMGVPLLLGLGAALLTARESFDLRGGLVVSGAVFTPLAVAALQQAGSRETGPHEIREGLLAVTSLDLSMPGRWVGWMLDSGLLTGWHDAERAGLSVAVIAALGFAAASWRRLCLVQRALLGASGGVLLGVAAFATTHHVRSPVAVVLLGVFAPLVASLPSLAEGRRRAWIAVAAWAPLALGVEDKWSRAEPPQDAMGWFAHHIRDFDAVRGDAPVWLRPRISQTTLHFYLVGHSWGPHAPATTCPGEADCFDLYGVRFRSDDAWPGPGVSALVVQTDLPGPNDGVGCLKLRDTTPTVWKCPAP